MPNPAAAAAITPERVAFYGVASSVAAAGVVLRAFRQRSNFYAATVWLGSSNGCMLVLLNFCLFMTLIFGRFLQKIFFGQLRAIEVEHLYERSWYSLVDTLLAMAIFRDEFDVSFVLLFGTLLFLKAFHWLSADRVEFMEQSPSVSRLFHVRMVTILWMLLAVDTFLVGFVIELLLFQRSNVGIMILFASEVSPRDTSALLMSHTPQLPGRAIPADLVLVVVQFITLMISLWSTIAKYIINCQDLRSDEPWEAKSMYIFYVDLCNDLLKLVTHLSFFVLLTRWYGLPLSQIRDVYVTGRSCASKIRDLIRYRAATRNMDSRYPDATPNDMRAMSDGTCIICREDMVIQDANDPSPPPSVSNRGLNMTPKRLPCGHIFHFHCLRAWLERQQSCPTCRRSVLEETPQDSGNPAAAAAPHATPTPTQPAANAAPTDEQPTEGSRAFDRRLQEFLQRIQSDARRVREEGNASARRAGRRSGQRTPLLAPNTATAPSTLPLGSTAQNKRTPTSHACAEMAQQSPAPPKSNRAATVSIGRSTVSRTYLPHAGPDGGLWVAPPPQALEMPWSVPSLAGHSKDGRKDFKGTATDPGKAVKPLEGETTGGADGGERAGAAKKVAADGGRDKNDIEDDDNDDEADDDDDDEMDEAARARDHAAKLNIWLDSLQKKSSLSVSSDNHGAAGPSQASGASQLPSALPSEPVAAAEADATVPHLIPLFDPARIPHFDSIHVPQLPYQLLPTTPTTATKSPLQKLECLSDEQLKRMALDSRAGLEEYVRLLGQVQANVSGLVEQLTRVLSIDPSHETSASWSSLEAEAQKGKGKAPAEGPNAL
ncbi:E3 ubiquitin-protein ligase hrd1 [Thecaphora frezii]